MGKQQLWKTTEYKGPRSTWLKIQLKQFLFTLKAASGNERRTVFQKWMWELVPWSTLGDVGGNSMETADGSIAAELWLNLVFVFWVFFNYYFSIGIRMWLKSFTISLHGPTARKKIVKSRQKTDVFRTGVYWSQWWRRAGECLRFSYLFLHEKVDDPSLYLSSGITTQVPVTSLLLVSPAAGEIVRIFYQEQY